jgi:valyl-tRNA synthetase
MMPFLSEELWQKLPQWENKPSSICIASYPEERANWKSEKVVLEFDQIQTIARSLRQMAAASNLPPSARAETYLLSVQDK